MEPYAVEVDEGGERYESTHRCMNKDKPDCACRFIPIKYTPPDGEGERERSRAATVPSTHAG